MADPTAQNDSPPPDAGKTPTALPDGAIYDSAAGQLTVGDKMTLDVSLAQGVTAENFAAALAAKNIGYRFTDATDAVIELVTLDALAQLATVPTPNDKPTPDTNPPNRVLVFVCDGNHRQWRTEVDLAGAIVQFGDGEGTASQHLTILEGQALSDLLAKPGLNGVVLVDSPAAMPGMLHRELRVDGGQGNPVGPALAFYELPGTVPMPAAPTIVHYELRLVALWSDGRETSAPFSGLDAIALAR